MKLRLQSLGEEIANAVSHGIGVLLGITALVLMLVKSDNGYEIASSIIFGMGMIILYLMSTLFHSFKNGSKVKAVFKRMDHISIYILIGSTFAPIFIIVVQKPLGWILLIIQWIIITLGIVFKAVRVYKYQGFHLFLFLLLGWSGLALVGPLYHLSHFAFWFILFGGISYSIGVVFYAFVSFKFQHFIWHIFVFLGTFFHFIAIYFYLF